MADRNPATESMLATEFGAPRDPRDPGALKRPATFTLRGLSVLAYANGFTLWHYKAPGELRDLMQLGFFAGADDMLAAGDLVMVTSSDGAAALLCVGPNGVVLPMARSM